MNPTWEKIDPTKKEFLDKYIENELSNESPEVVEEVLEFIKYLKRFGYDYSEHYLRYVRTYLELVKSFHIPRGKTIVELGGLAPITTYLSKFNDCFIPSPQVDFRIEIDIPESFADYVLSFEVFEHIKDVPEKSLDEVVLFNYSGAKKYISHISNILKPGGYLILTTPNPCSFKSILNILEFKHPYIFPHHVREYTKSEILDLFSGDFELIKYTTFTAFFVDAPRRISDLLSKLGYSLEDRFDTSFFIFKKW